MLGHHDSVGVLHSPVGPVRRVVTATLYAVTRAWTAFATGSAPDRLARCSVGVRRVGDWLDRSTYQHTNMRGACLRGADLRGVDLSEVEGLTVHQLKQAILDRRTTLPREVL